MAFIAGGILGCRLAVGKPGARPGWPAALWVGCRSFIRLGYLAGVVGVAGAGVGVAVAGAGVGLGQDAAVVVHDHAAAGPGKRPVVLEARALVGGHDLRHVLQSAAAIDDRPPIHRRRGSPGVHVGGDADEHLRAV